MPTTKSSILSSFCLVILTVCSINVYAQTEPEKRRQDSLDALIRSVGNRTDIAAARVLADVASGYISFDCRYALKIATQAESLAASANAPITPEGIRILIVLGLAYCANNNYDTAFASFERALAMARSIGANHEIAVALLEQGLVQGDWGQFDKELRTLTEAMQYAERTEDHRLKIRGLMSLAGLYHSTKQYARSDSLYSEAIKSCVGTRDDDVRATLYNNYGVLYEEMELLERALYLYRSGLEIERRLGRVRNIGRLFNNIGGIFMMQKRFDSALAYQTLALRLYEQTKYDAGLSNLLGIIAVTQNKMGRYNEAIESAKRALAFSEPSDFKLEKRVAYFALSDAYAGLRDFESSLQMFKEGAALQDSMYSIASAQKLAELETAQKEQEIKLLQSKQTQENIIRNALIAGALALAGFVALLIRGNNRRKRDNARLAELNDKLFDANEELSLLTSEKDEILNIVTHGLKSQIFGVRSLADSITTAFAGGAVPHNTAPLAEMSRTISHASTQMFSLVTNLLTVNTAEQGLLKPTLVRTDVGKVLNAVCEEFKDFAAVKSITLRVEAPESEEFFANADALMVNEVLENLVSNAVKYSPQGKTVVVRLKASNEAVRVEVQDEGEGISEADMTKLFGKFARLSARPTGGEHSTGLGLSIVKKMVEAMNGKVWCESELGKGATFIVELPMLANV